MKATKALLCFLACLVGSNAQTLALVNPGSNSLSPGSVALLNLTLSGSGGQVSGLQWNTLSTVPVQFLVNPSPGATATGVSVPCAAGFSTCLAINVSIIPPPSGTSRTLSDGVVATLAVTLPSTSATSTVSISLSALVATSQTGTPVTITAGPPVTLSLTQTTGSTPITFDAVMDLGFTPPTASLTTPGYTAAGPLFLEVTCTGCGTGVLPATAVSWGSSTSSTPLVRLGQASSTNGGGTVDVWWLPNPTAGTNPFTIQSTGQWSFHVLAISYKNVQGLDGSPVVNTTPLGNAMLATAVPVSAPGDWIVAFANGVGGGVTSDNGTVRVVAARDTGSIVDLGPVTAAGTTNIDTEMSFQGSTFGNAIVAIALKAAPSTTPPPVLTPITPSFFKGTSTTPLPATCPADLAFVELTDTHALLRCVAGGPWLTAQLRPPTLPVVGFLGTDGVCRPEPSGYHLVGTPVAYVGDNLTGNWVGGQGMAANEPIGCIVP